VDIDREVHAIVDKCFSRARKLLEENREKLDRLAKILLEREVLTGEEAEAVIEGSYVKKSKSRRKKDEHTEDAGSGKDDAGSDGGGPRKKGSG
jgi:cell division protease FtsH